MKRVSVLFAVLAVAACAEPSGPVSEGNLQSSAMAAKPAPPPSTNVPTSTSITVGFTGLAGDGRGAYMNGQSGVTSILRPDFNDHALELKSKGQKNPRSFTVGLNDPVPGSGAIALGSIKTVDAVILLEDVPAMAIGEARVLSRSLIYFWPPSSNADQYRLGANSGSSFLQAERLSATGWRIFTNPGGTAQLFRLVTSPSYQETFLGSYSVSMELTIQVN